MFPGHRARAVAERDLRPGVPFQNGSTAAVDDAYIQDSILEPNKQVVAGYRPIMPSYAGVISDADLAQLVAYIKSLGEGNQQTP